MKTIILLILILLNSSMANADNTKIIGFRVGPSFLLQDIDAETASTGTIGPIINGNISFEVIRNFFVGLNLEWESHGMNSLGVGIGHFRTFSIIPTIAYHLLEQSFMPYALFGLGANINFFSETSVISNAGFDIEPDTTFSANFGGGVDYKLSKIFALNSEVRFKLNMGNFNVNGVGVPADFNSNVFVWLFGGRFYF